MGSFQIPSTYICLAEVLWPLSKVCLRTRRSLNIPRYQRQINGLNSEGHSISTFWVFQRWEVTWKQFFSVSYYFSCSKPVHSTWWGDYTPVPQSTFSSQPPPTGRKPKLLYIAAGLNRDWWSGEWNGVCGSIVLTFLFASQISKMSYQTRYFILFVAVVNKIFFPLYLPNDYWWYLVKLLIYIYLFLLCYYWIITLMKLLLIFTKCWPYAMSFKCFKHVISLSSWQTSEISVIIPFLRVRLLRLRRLTSQGYSSHQWWSCDSNQCD